MQLQQDLDDEGLNQFDSHMAYSMDQTHINDQKQDHVQENTANINWNQDAQLSNIEQKQQNTNSQQNQLQDLLNIDDQMNDNNQHQDQIDQFEQINQNDLEDPQLMSFNIDPNNQRNQQNIQSNNNQQMYQSSNLSQKSKSPSNNMRISPRLNSNNQQYQQDQKQNQQATRQVQNQLLQQNTQRQRNRGGSHHNTSTQQQQQQQQTNSKYNILDREERDLINQAGNLSKEEIWEKLEQKRFNQLKRAAVNLQTDMLFNNRCPKCTLQPPCKHYQTTEQIIAEGTHIIQQPSFKQHVSPKKREVIIKTLREQQKAHHSVLQQSQDYLNQSQHSLQSKQTLGQIQQQNDNGFNQEQKLNNNYQTANISQNDVNAFITNTDMFNSNLQSMRNEVQGVKTNYITNLQTPKQSKIIHRNMFNNTVTGGGGISMYKNQNDSGKVQQSNLSQYGANIMAQQQSLQRKQYLRRRQGNGGSPVHGMTSTDGQGNSFLHIESKLGQDGPLIPKHLQDEQNQHRDRTTVRIRTKNNQYTYAQSTFGQPLHSTKNGLTQNHQYSFMENSQQSLYERERLQAVIAKYKEEKIQRQIERIEQERLQLEMEKKYQKEQDLKRRRYIELQKQRLAEYQSTKDKIESEKSEQDQMERKRWIEKERLRRDYFQSQKKYIVEYKEQKRKTDELLMIPSHHHSKNVPAYFAPQALYQPQVNSNGIMTKAGQQFISGQGKIASGRNQYVNDVEQDQALNQLNQDFGDDDGEEYYGEVYQPNNQQQQQHDAAGSKLTKNRQKNTSTGIIGQYDQDDISGKSKNVDSQRISNDNQMILADSNQQSQSKLMQKRDSLDLLQQ